MHACMHAYMCFPKQGFIYLLNLRLGPGTGREGRSEFFKIGGTRDPAAYLCIFLCASMVGVAFNLLYLFYALCFRIAWDAEG